MQCRHSHLFSFYLCLNLMSNCFQVSQESSATRLASSATMECCFRSLRRRYFSMSVLLLATLCVFSNITDGQKNRFTNTEESKNKSEAPSCPNEWHGGMDSEGHSSSLFCPFHCPLEQQWTFHTTQSKCLLVGRELDHYSRAGETILPLCIAGEKKCIDSHRADPLNKTNLNTAWHVWDVWLLGRCLTSPLETTLETCSPLDLARWHLNKCSWMTWWWGVGQKR